MIAILGAGGFAKEVLWCLQAEGRIPAQVASYGFIDENRENHGKMICGIPVAGDFGDLNQLASVEVISGVGSPSLRKRFAGQTHHPFITTIHPSVQKSAYVDVGVGTILCAGCIITADIKIGNHVNLNLDCTVGHDTIIGDYCNISPGVHISGHVTIEDGVDIGTGATILPNVKIGAWSVIGAGATVTKDIPPYSVAVGTPAKVIKEIKHD